ncbi:MAG: hypothetical protein WKG07_00595 [Hymenobacter sp.]
MLQALVLGLGLVGTLLNYLFDLSYDASWYIFALRGILIYGLIVVGIQANYAAATSPLRFDAAPPPLPPCRRRPAPEPAAAAPAPPAMAAPPLGPTPPYPPSWSRCAPGCWR